MGDTYIYDDNEGDHNADNPLNWLPTRLVVPGNGDIIDIVEGLANSPSSPISLIGGAVFHFNITTAYSNQINLGAFVNGTGGTPDLIGDVTLNNALAECSVSIVPISGNLVVTAGWLDVYVNVAGTASITGLVYFKNGVVATGKITVNAGGYVEVFGTVYAVGGVDCAGTVKLYDGNAVLDCGAAFTATANCTIDWNGGEIMGIVNANGFTITHTNVSAGSNIVVDTDGTLNFGSTDAALDGLDISTGAGLTTATLGAVLRCGALAHAVGTIATANFAVTCAAWSLANGSTFTGGTSAISCTSFTMPGGTLTGSGAITVAGNISITGGTQSHTGTWTASGTAGSTINTTSYLRKLTKLVLDGSYTANGEVDTKWFAGAGSLALGANALAVWENWTFTGTVTTTSTGFVRISDTASYTFASPINVSVPLHLRPNGNYVFTMGAAVSCTALTVSAYSTTVPGSVVLNGGSSLGAVTMGEAAGTNRIGSLTFGAGNHALTSITRAGTNTSAVTLSAGAILRASGTITGTGITVTNNGGRINCDGTGRVTAVAVTGSRLCVYGARGGTLGTQVRGWNQDSCTNGVRHYPRRTICACMGLMTP